jgi:hypothetical protein
VKGAAGAIYTGHVVHRRFRPRTHRLRYAMVQLLIDIDAADDLDRALKLFSHNRFNLFSFHDADHGDGRGRLRAWVDEILAAIGIDLGGGEVRLLCMPRMLGHVFNPLSVYFCRRPGGELAAMIYEVNNTFGERHCYVIPAAWEGDRIRQSCAKAFYVSPFMEMAMTYEFTLTVPGEEVAVTVEGRDGAGAPVIAATFSGVRGEISDRNLAKAFATHPLLTLKVVAAIRFEAARLALEGFRLHRKPAAPRPLAARAPA